MPTFTIIKESIEKSMGKRLTIDHIKQMLYLVPNFYNHRWETKSASALNKASMCELVLEVPQNIKEILGDYPNSQKEPSVLAYDNQMLSDVLMKRKLIFKMRLYSVVYEHFQNFRTHLMETPGFTELFDADPFAIKQWPSYFDPHTVPDIPKAVL
jgi:hypothetical protein